MPLKLRIKPEGTFYVNGATLKNGGSRPIDIIVLEGDIQRDKGPITGRITEESKPNSWTPLTSP